MSGLARDPLLYTRLLGLAGAVVWLAIDRLVVVPLAALALLTLLVGTAVWLRWRVRQSDWTSLRSLPVPVVLLDLVAAASWMAAVSLDLGAVSFGLVVAAGGEALLRLGRRGIWLTLLAYAAARAVGEWIRMAAGLPFDGVQALREGFVALLLLLVMSIIVATVMHEERRALTALERARGLGRVAAEISAQTADPEALLRSIPQTVLTLVDADYAALAVHRGREFEVVAGAGAAQGVVGLRAPMERGLVGQVIAGRVTVVTSDYRSHPTGIGRLRELGLRAVMGVPIFVHGEVAAILTLGRILGDRPFDDDERVAAEGFASHVAIALANARTLYLSRRLEVVARIVAGEGTPDEVVGRIAEHAAGAFNAEFVLVLEITDGLSRAMAAVGAASPLTGRREERLGPMMREVVESRALVAVRDYVTERGPSADAQARAEPEGGRSGSEVARESGIHATIAAPAIVDGRVAAILVVATTDPHRTFDRIDRQGLIAFADSTASALRAAEVRRDRELRIRRLDALNALAAVLAQLRDPVAIARVAWETTGTLVPRDAFYVARYDGERRQFDFLFQEDDGRIDEADSRESWDPEFVVPLGTGPTSQAALTGELYHTRQPEDPVQHRSRRFGDSSRESASAVHVPLKSAGRVIGVLSAQSYRPDAYDEEDVAILRSLGDLVAAAFANVEHVARTRELYLASVKALAAAVDARDPYTRSHSARVAALSRIIAEEMRLAPDEIRRVQLGALLHDIGKIGIPDSILNKPAALAEDEWVIMRTHSALGASILEAVEPLRDLVQIVRCHHERFDGAGYPASLRGDEVPLAAYIVAAADAYEVIVSKRAYKQAQSVDFAISELVRCRGTQFHPGVADAFLRVIERDRVEGTARLSRVGSIEHEDIEDVPGPGEVLERYAARSHTRTRQLAILQRLATEISAVLDMETLAGRLLRIVVEAMGYENGFLTTLDDGGERLVVQAGVGPSTDYVGGSITRGQGISWWVLENGRLQNVPDVRVDTRYFGPPEIRSSLIVPLRMGDERVGVLGIEATHPNAFTTDDEELLTAVSHQIAAAIRVARLHQAAKTAAATDPLTNLPNRRVFFERLEAGLAKSAEGAPLSVAILDVNLLKDVNDRWGHASGDEALVRIGEILAAGVRGEDTVARTGGDEFGVVFPGAAIFAAERIMRRLADQVASSTLADGRPLPTVAWGIAAAPIEPISADALVDLADRAMYRQKQLGRPRTA